LDAWKLIVASSGLQEPPMSLSIGRALPQPAGDIEDAANAANRPEDLTKKATSRPDAT
jgi:hypothetical protein